VAFTNFLVGAERTTIGVDQSDEWVKTAVSFCLCFVTRLSGSDQQLLDSLRSGLETFTIQTRKPSGWCPPTLLTPIPCLRRCFRNSNCRCGQCCVNLLLVHCIILTNKCSTVFFLDLHLTNSWWVFVDHFVSTLYYSDEQMFDSFLPGLASDQQLVSFCRPFC